MSDADTWTVIADSSTVRIRFFDTVVMRISHVGIYVRVPSPIIPHHIMDRAWVAWLAIKDSVPDA